MVWRKVRMNFKNVVTFQSNDSMVHNFFNFILLSQYHTFILLILLLFVGCLVYKLAPISFPIFSTTGDFWIFPRSFFEMWRFFTLGGLVMLCSSRKQWFVLHPSSFLIVNCRHSGDIWNWQIGLLQSACLFGNLWSPIIA